MAKQNQPPAAGIVGLARAESMPISFMGRTFDLARLSDADRAFLAQYPQQVPYLATAQASDNSQPSAGTSE